MKAKTSIELWKTPLNEYSGPHAEAMRASWVKNTGLSPSQAEMVVCKTETYLETIIRQVATIKLEEPEPDKSPQ